MDTLVRPFFVTEVSSITSLTVCSRKFELTTIVADGVVQIGVGLPAISTMVPLSLSSLLARRVTSFPMFGTAGTVHQSPSPHISGLNPAIYACMLLGILSVSLSCGFKLESNSIGDRQSPALERLGIDDQAPQGSLRALRLPSLELLDIDVQIVTVPFHIGTGEAEIHVDTPRSEEVAEFRPILEREILLYPAEFWKESGLRRLILCSNLTARSDGRTHGLFRHRTREIYIDVAPLVRRRRPETLHHEIFHFVDHVVGQKMAHDEWACLGMSDADQLSGPDSMAGLSPTGGFVSRYSMMSDAEDKAVLFGMAMSDPVQLEYFAKRDRAIQQKVELIVAALRKFCPSCDESFWERVRDHRITDPSYAEWAKELLREYPVHLVQTPSVLEDVVQSSKSAQLHVTKLATALVGVDLNLLDVHSTSRGNQPFYELHISEGDSCCFLGVTGVVLSDEQVAPELANELRQRQHLELPLVLDLIFGPETSGGPPSFFVSAKPFVK
jgi:hypothetical protein